VNNIPYTKEQRKKAAKITWILRRKRYGPSGGNKCWSDERRREFSDLNKGEKNPFYGKHHSEDTKTKMGNSQTIRFEDQSERDKISRALKKYCKNHPEILKERGEKFSLFLKNHPEVVEEMTVHVKDPIVQQKISRSLKDHYATLTQEEILDQARHGLMAARGKKPSKPQKELFCLVQSIALDAVMEYVVRTGTTIYFLDIAIPSKKIDIEFDCEYWHELNGIERDRKRDKELIELGWKVFRVNYDLLRRINTIGLVRAIPKLIVSTGVNG